tara:strand:+ start:336 stop:1169 length:834 start_codon:yes stop_codon:yes gene_type:complete
MKHYSNSALGKRIDCGQAFKYKYIDQLHERTKPSLIFGSAIDAAINAVHYNMMNKDLPQLHYDQVILNYFNQEKNLLEHELEKEDWDALEDMILNMIDHQVMLEFEEIIDYVPKEIQKKITLKIHGLAMPVIGYPDLIAERKEPAFQEPGQEVLILDGKTSKQKISKVSHGYKQQLSTYVLAIMREKGLKNIPSAELRVLVKTKKPYWQVIPVHLTADDLGLAIEAYREHELAIAANWFPLNRGSVFCSKKNCRYFEQCHEDHQSDLHEILSQVSYA